MAKGGIEHVEQVIIPTPVPNYPPGGYHNLPKEIIAELNRGQTFYFGIELFPPGTDEIWASPNMAVFHFSDSKFIWQGIKYKDKVEGIPELSKFIGKTFNRFSVELVNVQRGLESGSNFIFKYLIRGFRVGVRMIFPDLGIEHSRLIWWGRVMNVEDITEKAVRLNCSQEVGDFSYELATQKYGQACPLWFGKGECLGNETLEQKSSLFQSAFNTFGQGGCNRTEVRCKQFDRAGEADSQRRLFQGQNIVTVIGQFIREEIVKKKILWFITIKKKNRIPVQWSSKNQSDNDDVNIPLAFGRVRIDLHAFTWADIGTQIIALMGGCKGQIEGFYNITCHNPNLTIAAVTQHLGELGGVGSQQPDGRFVASGHNSKLAYLGITFNGSPPEDEPEEVPAVSAVVKGSLIPVRNRFGTFTKQWSNNPVWIARALLLNFPFTVVKESWFNEIKNQQTADYCFTVIEDDTDAEIPVISGSSEPDYQEGQFKRFRSTNRYDAHVHRLHNIEQQLIGQSELSNELQVASISPEVIPIDIEYPDIWWASPIGNSAIGQSRTYLALRYTANGVINDKAKLSDVLFSLVFPTFRGYMRFNHFGQVEIDCRKPADNTFIRANVPLASTVIPVASVVKFISTYGYLLIGVGKNTSEIAKIKGIRYVNGAANAQVSVTTSGTIAIDVDTEFQERDGGPAEIYMDFSGTPSIGERICLKFDELIDQNDLSWDYFVDDAADDLDIVVQMFKTRLMASPAFREHFTADVFGGFPHRIVIRCQTGYIQLDRPTRFTHEQGEEVLRVVEVYEDGRDPEHEAAIADNMKEFIGGLQKQETYHAVEATYISAVQDFRETIIQPRVSWDAAEQERNLNKLSLDLRFVDNYRQAAWLTKSATIDFVDGNLWSKWKTGIRGLYHEEGDVVAVRHQTFEGLSYIPYSIEDISYSHATMETPLVGKLYLSAAFDERVAKEEKFLEASLTTNPNYQATPPPILTAGGYSSTGTGDGGGGIRQNIRYETQRYEVLPSQQVYSPEGRDKL